MNLYLVVFACVCLLANAHSCQQLGSSTLAKVSLCKIQTPAPQLKWTLNFTLLQDYAWRGSEQIRYFYLTNNDQPIDQTCYQGQTIKGNYKAGTSLQVEQLCFNFRPSLQQGDKLYLLLFWDKPASSQMAVYVSFTTTGSIEAVQASPQELVQLRKRANLVTQ